jgi:hypothetical protein
MQKYNQYINLKYINSKYISTNIYFDDVVPERSPLNIKTLANSSWSIIVSWDPVPKIYRNGIIIGYKVVYYSLNITSAFRVYHNLTVPSTKRTVDIFGLKQANLYCVQIHAFTRIGDGTISSCVTIGTPKQGKLVFGFFSRPSLPFFCRYVIGKERVRPTVAKFVFWTLRHVKKNWVYCWFLSFFEGVSPIFFPPQKSKWELKMIISKQ